MIEISGRALAKAWRAVSLAGSDAEFLTAMYRSVHVELFETGVRLVSTDSFWMARCWVPLDGSPWSDEPPIEELPAVAVTVLDREHRVLDLMRYVSKSTAQKDAADITMTFDPSAAALNEAVPTLDPSWAQPRCAIGIPEQEGVLCPVAELPFPNWRATSVEFCRPPAGTRDTKMAGWMVERLAMVAKIAGSCDLRLVWVDSRRGRWEAIRDADSTEPAHRPCGVFMACYDPFSRGDRAAVPDDPDGDGPAPTSPEPDDESTDVTPDDETTPTPAPRATAADIERMIAAIPDYDTEIARAHDEMVARARTLVVSAGRGSSTMLCRKLRIGPAYAEGLLTILEERGVVGPAAGRKPREVLIEGDR